MTKTARDYPEFEYRADESLASWTVENTYAHSAAMGSTRRIDYGDYGADVPLRDIVCRVAELQTLTPFEHAVLMHDVTRACVDQEAGHLGQPDSHAQDDQRDEAGGEPETEGCDRTKRRW